MEIENMVWIIKVVVSALAVVLNVSVILIISRRPATTRPSSLLLLHLSFADLLHGAVTILAFAGKSAGFKDGSLFSVVVTIIAATALLSSILHTSAITFDRYAAVRWPFRYKMLMSHSKIKAVIVIFWSFSLALGLPIMMGGKYLFADYVIIGAIYASSLLILFAYIQIARYAKHAKLWRRRNGISGGSVEQRTSVICTCIVLCFLLCHLPFAALDTFLIVRGVEALGRAIMSAFFLLLLCNTVGNPLLYVILCRTKRNHYNFHDRALGEYPVIGLRQSPIPGRRMQMKGANQETPVSARGVDVKT